MLSCGIFSALAAATAVRSRAFVSGLPPPFAATAISFRRRVKILPRLASSAPFLCLMVAHFEWPDIGTSDAVGVPGVFQRPTSEYTIRGDDGVRLHICHLSLQIALFGRLQKVL